MHLPHPAAAAMAFLSWVAILLTLALYGTMWLVVSALRLVVGEGKGG
jgi:hypothetical protein